MSVNPCRAHNRGLGPRVHAYVCVRRNKLHVRIYYAVSFSRGPPRRSVATADDDLTGFDAARIYVLARACTHIYIHMHALSLSLSLDFTHTLATGVQIARARRPYVNYTRRYHSRIASE